MRTSPITLASIRALTILLAAITITAAETGEVKLRERPRLHDRITGQQYPHDPVPCRDRRRRTKRTRHNGEAQERRRAGTAFRSAWHIGKQACFRHLFVLAPAKTATRLQLYPQRTLLFLDVRKQDRTGGVCNLPYHIHINIFRFKAGKSR